MQEQSDLLNTDEDEISSDEEDILSDDEIDTLVDMEDLDDDESDLSDEEIDALIDEDDDEEEDTDVYEEEEGGILSDDEIEALVDAFDTEETEVLEAAEEDRYKVEKEADYGEIVGKVGRKDLEQSLIGFESRQGWKKTETFLTDISNRFEVVLSSSIANSLGKIDVFAKSLPIGYSTYGKVINSVFSGNGDASCIISFPFKESKLDAPDIVKMDLNLAFCIIDLFLGGNGLSIPEKKLTEFERSIISKIMIRIKSDLTNMLHPSFELEDYPPKVLSYMDLGNIFYQDQQVISLPFELTFQPDPLSTINGNFTVYIPYSILNIEDLYNFDKTGFGKGKLAETSIEEKVMDIPLTLKVCFPSRTITIRELLNLKNGDIIKLNTTTEDKTNIKLQEKKKFLGIPVLVGNQKAVEISDTPENWNSPTNKKDNRGGS